ncbi:hypothetical protein BJ684DRAFT_11006, partial [Piptocephalis cylindrospora]
MNKGNIQPFLAKLYCMVNDPETDRLIAWAPNGASFYVFRSDELARTVLPKFFKHGNFSSFVRQLNLYGFHKVPQLTQATLATSSRAECWQFANPIFCRGQPDLLVLGERRKNTQSTPISQTDGTVESGYGDGSGDGKKRRRHQAELSQELRRIQEGNTALWKEADRARDRSARQQDMLDKILRFLASVF